MTLKQRNYKGHSSAYGRAWQHKRRVWLFQELSITAAVYQPEEHKMNVSVDPVQFMETKKSLESLKGSSDQMFLLFMGGIIFCEYLNSVSTMSMLD